MFEALIIIAFMFLVLWFSYRLDAGTKKLSKQLRAMGGPIHDLPAAPDGRLLSGSDSDKEQFAKDADLYLSATHKMTRTINRQSTIIK